MSDADLNRPPNLFPPYGRKSVAGQLGKMGRAINRGNQGVDPPYQVLAAVAAEGAAAAEPDIITVVAMSGADVALTGLTSLDGVTLDEGDKVLLQGQTDLTQNGVWTYHVDPDTEVAEFLGQSQYWGVLVEMGDLGGASVWVLDLSEDVYTYNEIGARTRELEITAIHDNYLVCDDWWGPSVNVARPALNRRDSPEGGSVAAGGTTGTRNSDTLTYVVGTPQTRVVSRSGYDWSPENQTIGPTIYRVGDSVPVVPTWVTVQKDSSGTLNCEWLSVDARVWGLVPA